MKASFVDLRRKTKEILEALDRNESVTILYRGKVKGIITPAGEKKAKRRSIAEHPAVGMWKDREDMKNVATYIRKLRRPRFGAL